MFVTELSCHLAVLNLTIENTLSVKEACDLQSILSFQF